MKGYINIYRSGYYHRCGKPHTFDRHGGDIYATPCQALAAIEPRELYCATVPIEWDEKNSPCENGPFSIPVPLSQSRRELALQQSEGGADD